MATAFSHPRFIGQGWIRRTSEAISRANRMDSSYFGPFPGRPKPLIPPDLPYLATAVGVPASADGRLVLTSSGPTVSDDILLWFPELRDGPPPYLYYYLGPRTTCGGWSGSSGC